MRAIPAQIGSCPRNCKCAVWMQMPLERARSGKAIRTKGTSQETCRMCNEILPSGWRPKGAKT